MRQAPLLLLGYCLIAVSATAPSHAAQATFGSSVTFTDSTIGQPTFNRPELGFPPLSLSATATAVPYVSQPFEVYNTGSYQFSVQPGGIPGVSDFVHVFLYRDRFDPSHPLTNVMIGAAPFQGGTLPGFSVPILFGSTRHYVLVVTGKGNNNAGAFTGTISRANSFIVLGTPSSQTQGIPFQFSPLLGLLLWGGTWGLGRWRHQAGDRSNCPNRHPGVGQSTHQTQSQH